jgi:hypothetical protein
VNNAHLLSYIFFYRLKALHDCNFSHKTLTIDGNTLALIAGEDNIDQAVKTLYTSSNESQKYDEK